MFFIFWGQKSRYEPHGVVGDACPVCDRVRAFSVRDVFTAPHVYFITLGGWTFQARVKHCWECGTDFYARLRDYDDFVPEDEAERMSVRAIVRRTNHPLADWMDGRRPSAERSNEMMDFNDLGPDRDR